MSHNKKILFVWSTTCHLVLFSIFCLGSLILSFRYCSTIQVFVRLTNPNATVLPSIPLLNDLELSHDHHTRWTNAYSRGRAKPARRFIMWLHIPKTGTSFINTLIRWGCPSVPSNTFIVPRKERPSDMSLAINITKSWDWLFSSDDGRKWLSLHCTNRLLAVQNKKGKLRKGNLRYAVNMHRPMQPNEARYTVALFRLPRQRMYSNYLHLAYHYNTTRQPKRSLSQFLKKSQFWSQQTKLLLGRDYRDKAPLTMDHAKEAANIVMNKLPFVGLTEEFHLSIRLFHAIFGGVPHALQFENVRPGITRYQVTERRSIFFRYNETEFAQWHDPPDDVVYDTARTRFWMDVCRTTSQIELDGLGPIFAPICYTPMYSPTCHM